MNKAIANILKSKLAQAAFPWLTKLGGLVEVYEYEDTTFGGENGEIQNTIIKRIPVTLDTTRADCDREEMIPTSDQKCIIYFEETGPITAQPDGGYLKYTSALRLVCWFNQQWFTGNALTLSVQLQHQVQKQLRQLEMQNVGIFLRLSIRINSISMRDKGIFSKYTYDFLNNDTLLSPNDFFAMDLAVSYLTAPSCATAVTMVETVDCGAAPTGTDLLP